MGLTKHCATTFSITSLNLKTRYNGLICDTQHNFLSIDCHYSECRYAVTRLLECYAECHYAECHCAECHYAVSLCCVIMLSVMALKTSSYDIMINISM